jgi:hypothetical protein
MKELIKKYDLIGSRRPQGGEEEEESSRDPDAFRYPVVFVLGKGAPAYQYLAYSKSTLSGKW